MDNIKMEEETKQIIINKVLLKNTRNQLLAETDKYLLPDFPINADNLVKIMEYRKLLRDFTKNNYILPDKPDFIS